jgi:DMSO/TMAO reductase YedYZ heme-binding membrane subunit
VPGASDVHPLLSALGIVAAELLAALAVANHYRRRLSHRTWRRLHYANFAVWALALAHGAMLGTDRTSSWGYALFVGSAAAVAGATTWRILAARDARRPARPAPAVDPTPAPAAARGTRPQPALDDPFADIFR